MFLEILHSVQNDKEIKSKGGFARSLPLNNKEKEFTIYEEDLCITSRSRGKRSSRVNACSVIEDE